MNGLTHEDGDRWQIYEAVLRYCRGIDRHDTELMRSAYHPDAIDHHTGFSGKVGDFIDWLDPLWKYYKGSMHFVGNHWAEISGNDAVVETYGMSVHWGELEDDKLNTTNGFRYVDHSKGTGIFARPGGTYEQHSIFWVNCDLPIAHDHFKVMHIAFGLEDIDEVMLGANIMEAKGWKNESMNSSGGISRHRISSAIYYYCDIPGKAGEAEYHADTDYLDDNWVPRAWDFRFGSLLWSNNAPPIFRGDNIPWDMTFDADRASFEPFRKTKPGKQPTSDPTLSRLTDADEHAI